MGCDVGAKGFELKRPMSSTYMPVKKAKTLVIRILALAAMVRCNPRALNSYTKTLNSEPCSKLLVSPLIPIVVPYIIPYIARIKELRL